METWEAASRELEVAWSCRNPLRVLPQARGWSFLFCLFLHHWQGISSRVPGQVYFRAEKVGLPHSHVLMKLECEFPPVHSRTGRVTVAAWKFLEEVDLFSVPYIMVLWPHAMEEGSVNFVCEEPDSVFTFACHAVSAETIRLYCCKLLATPNNKYMT